MESLYIVPILLFSVVVHEVAHGWIALRLGDPTAKDAGRLTLNPIPHIDPIGSIAVPLISFLTAGTVFIAWAKPVPVNPSNFRRLRQGDILVSLAGPVSNFFVALLCVGGFSLSAHAAESLQAGSSDVVNAMLLFLIKMFGAGITLNIFLAIFNLIPVPPLDGSHVLASVLPAKAADRFREIGFFGILLVLLLMRLDPVRHFILSLVMTIQVPYEFLLHALS